MTKAYCCLISTTCFADCQLSQLSAHQFAVAHSCSSLQVTYSISSHADRTQEQQQCIQAHPPASCQRTPARSKYLYQSLAVCSLHLLPMSLASVAVLGLGCDPPLTITLLVQCAGKVLLLLGRDCMVPLVKHSATFPDKACWLRPIAFPPPLATAAPPSSSTTKQQHHPCPSVGLPKTHTRLHPKSLKPICPV